MSLLTKVSRVQLVEDPRRFKAYFRSWRCTIPGCSSTNSPDFLLSTFSQTQQHSAASWACDPTSRLPRRPSSRRTTLSRAPNRSLVSNYLAAALYTPILQLTGVSDTFAVVRTHTRTEILYALPIHPHHQELEHEAHNLHDAEQDYAEAHLFKVYWIRRCLRWVREEGWLALRSRAC